MSNNTKNVIKIKENIYDHWYHIFVILRFSLIIDILKLIVDRETDTIAMEKNKKILLQVVDKA